MRDRRHLRIETTAKLDARDVYYKGVLKTSAEVVAWRERERDLRVTYHRNRERLLARPELPAQPFTLLETEPNVLYYDLQISPDGELFTTDIAAHPHLADHQKDTGRLPLTVGDLDAAAQWGMLPKLVTAEQQPAQETQRARLLINRLIYDTLARRSNAEAKLYQNQVWEDMKRHGFDREPQDIVRPVTAEMVEQALTSHGALAERIAATTLARIGSRCDPPLRVFQANAMQDERLHVDLLARVITDGSPWVVGIDITTSLDPQNLQTKRNFVERFNGKQHKDQIHDPITQKGVPLRHALAIWSRIATPASIINTWKQRRGNTMMTPEYLMSSDDRTLLLAVLLSSIRTMDGNPVYDEDHIIDAYRQTYGGFERRSSV